MGERLGQRFEFGGNTGAGTGDFRVLAHAVSGRFGAVCGTEGIHHPDIAERGHFLREFLVALLLALVAAAVFQHDDFAGLDFKTAIHPVLHQTNRFAEQFAHARGDRCQGIFGFEFAFGRAAQVRGDHHRRAFFKRVADTRQGGADTGVIGNGKAVVLRDVEVGADEHPLPGNVEIGESFESHGKTPREE